MSRCAAAAMAVLLGLGAVGCSSDDSPSVESERSTTTAPEGTTTTAAPKPAKGDKYVALGSSIASGYGISVQSTSCGRSNRNYPNLVAKELELELVDVTCGAAAVTHVVDEKQGDNPIQLDAVTPDTKLITVTVGGNDIRYNGTALACGDPASVCTAPPTLEADLATTKAALHDMLERIRAAAPEATIVFVTYPREVPAEGNCPELSFTDDEVEAVRAMGQGLQDVFQEIREEEDDLVFVDPYVAEGDHTGCAPAAERWTAGFKADDGFAYHPTALGHEVMAEMIVEALGG